MNSIEGEETSLFCIDTSALLHAWNRDYPPDVFITIWGEIEHMVSTGQLIAPDEILLELERGGDEIYEWAKENRNMFIIPDGNAQKVVEDIVNRYPTFLPKASYDGVWADPYVIGLAATKGAVVITGEKMVGPNAKAPKIPNICSDLGIHHTDMLGLLRAIGMKV